MKLLSVIAAGVIVAALGSSPAAADTPSDQLVVGMTMANVLDMDPNGGNPFEKTHILIQVYDRLMEIDAENPSQLNPLLAESWVLEDDGSLTLNLRDDAVFHSGNKVTAEDVVFSLQRPLLAALNAASVYRAVGFTTENVTDLITAVDDYTVRIERPGDINLTIFMYSVLAQPQASILDKAVVMANENDGDWGQEFLNTQAAGSGQFQLTRWSPNEIVLLDRFDDHWSEPSAMRRIVVRHIPEAQSQRLQIERGDIDLAYVLAATDYAVLDENPDVEVQKVVGDGYYHISMTVDHPILGNPDVRRALRYLMPYDGLQESVMTYFSTPWRWPVAQGYLGQMEENLEVEYDVERARELLAQAGYPDGFELELLSLSQPPFSEIAAVFQEAAAPAGVRLNIVTGGGSVVFGQMRQREFELIVGRALGSRYGDPHSNMTAALYNPDNSDNSTLQNYPWRAEFQDAEINRMIEEAAAELDQERRAEIYRAIQLRFEELSPHYILIGQRIDPFAVRAEVDGIVGHASWTTRWDLATKP